MKNSAMHKQSYAEKEVIDVAKICFALSVLVCHSVAPPVFWECNFGLKIFWFFYNVINRLAVPFFFACTGFFLHEIISDSNNKKIYAFTKKIFVTYVGWTIVYLPFIYGKVSLFEFAQKFLFFGSVPVFWYLTSLIVGINFLRILVMKCGVRNAGVVLISLYLFVFGLQFLETYSQYIIDFMSDYRSIFYTENNGIFFGAIFLYIGYIFRTSNSKSVQILAKSTIPQDFVFLIVGLALLFVEAVFLQYTRSRDSIFLLTLPVCSYCLFALLLKIDSTKSFGFIGTRFSLLIRKTSGQIYLNHMFFLYLYITFFAISPEQRLLFTFVLSLAFSIFLVLIRKKFAMLKYLGV